MKNPLPLTKKKKKKNCQKFCSIPSQMEGGNCRFWKPVVAWEKLRQNDCLVQDRRHITRINGRCKGNKTCLKCWNSSTHEAVFDENVLGSNRRVQFRKKSPLSAAKWDHNETTSGKFLNCKLPPEFSGSHRPALFLGACMACICPSKHQVFFTAWYRILSWIELVPPFLFCYSRVTGR